jgi:hypothetical protein
MQALHAAHADRSNALLTVQTLMSELEATNIRVEKLNVAASRYFGVDNSRNRKIEELKEQAKADAQARDLAQQQYESIKVSLICANAQYRCYSPWVVHVSHCV